jgi:endonuclease/exonuclease/phosphatase family metal-dependent hydrolase
VLLALAAALPLACPPVTQNVLVFNVEYGGGLVDFAKTVEVVRRSEADIVLIEEAWGHIPRLARALGWTEYDVRHQVLSRRPLLDPAADDPRYLYAETSPGCVVAVANVHLPSDPDPPDRLENAAAIESAVAVERRTRLAALSPTLLALGSLKSGGMPVLLGGDFNAPSHLDDPRVPWPVSRAIAEAGLSDVWREARPDPAAHPGHTWWAARPKVEGWNPSPQARQTRIDQLHAGGGIRVREARLMGEEDRPGIAIAVHPWPSDHRGLLATLEIAPAPAPTLVTAWPPRVVRGDPLRVRARGTRQGARIVVAPSGVDPRSISPSREASPDDLSFDTREFAPGSHTVSLLDVSGRPLGASPFWVTAPGSRPRIELARDHVNVGTPIEVRWADAPGCRWDWVGVYPDGADPETGGQPLVWRHTRATVAGTARLDSTAEGDGWPLGPGRYRVALFEDDTYAPLVAASLTVLR